MPFVAPALVLATCYCQRPATLAPNVPLSPLKYGARHRLNRCDGFMRALPARGLAFTFWLGCFSYTLMNKSGS